MVASKNKNPTLRMWGINASRHQTEVFDSTSTVCLNASRHQTKVFDSRVRYLREQDNGVQGVAGSDSKFVELAPSKVDGMFD